MKRNASIRTIIFDLSEVLISGLVGIERPLSEKLRISEDSISKAFYNDCLAELCRGAISEVSYLKHVVSENGWSIPLEVLKRVIRENFHHRIPGMAPILDRLKGRYELALLSDHVREWIAYIRSIHPFLEAFDHFFFSFVLGTTKDDPATFRAVLEALHRDPAACLFIDDNPMNIETATSLGISCVRFISAADLSHRLEALGLWR